MFLYSIPSRVACDHRASVPPDIYEGHINPIKAVSDG